MSTSDTTGTRRQREIRVGSDCPNKSAYIDILLARRGPGQSPPPQAPGGKLGAKQADDGAKLSVYQKAL